MGNQNKQEFDLMSLTPELQIKVFEALPSPLAAVDLALTCRDLNALFAAYNGQIMAAIRDNMVAPFYEYYAFLGSLHIPESGIKHPPAGGWPNITLENCSKFGKSDFAVDILRHLPYIVEDCETYNVNIHNIDYECNVVDYSEATYKDFRGSTLKCDVRMYNRFRSPMTRHKVLIAVAHDYHGVELILDTSTGLIYEEYIECYPGKTRPVREHFARKMMQCRELRQVFLPGGDPYCAEFNEGEPPWDAAAMEDMVDPSTSWPPHWFNLNGVREDNQDLKWVRRLYTKFGWPGKDWRKEEGLKAIREYMDRRKAAVEEWEAQLRNAPVLQQLGPTVGVLHSF